ncbi:amidohydrolase, partial [Staphylococcus aureus]|nr:amidohydrolase [Staphylococcus aureus]
EILDEHKLLLVGYVVLIFQYGEVIMPGGSQYMIDAGCLEIVDRIYGTHLWSGYTTGTFHSRAWAIMSYPDEFSVTI